MGNLKLQNAEFLTCCVVNDSKQDRGQENQQHPKVPLISLREEEYPTRPQNNATQKKKIGLVRESFFRGK